MIVDTLLLPRFLILELVVASHYLELARATALLGATRPGRGVGGARHNGSTECVVPLWEVPWRPARPPLLLVSGRAAVPRPVGRGKPELRLAAGQGLTLACPGGTIGGGPGGEQRLECGPGGHLTGPALASLGCSTNPREAEQVEEGRCGPDGRATRLNIGFRLAGSFVPVLQVCHSGGTEETHWVGHTLQGASLGARGYGRGASHFREGRVFYQDMSAGGAYSRRGQRRHLATEHGGAERARGLFPNTFDRGHLAPSADFLFEDWQEATFFYANTAPQWRSVNRGNWARVEAAVREVAAAGAGRELEVVTGGLGRLVRGGRQVWLARRAIPVPRVLWKVVRDPATGRSIVLLTLNNPEYKRVTKVQVFCPDRCEETGWAAALPSRRRLRSGYTFCCSTEDLARSLPWLPGRLANSTGLLHFHTSTTTTTSTTTSSTTTSTGRLHP